MATLQKLKYDDNGRNAKDKFKGGYNTTDLVYGLSGYIAFDDIVLVRDGLGQGSQIETAAAQVLKKTFLISQLLL